jgi:NAD(P)-dependent dehydrogenase (short-subunit alcohol dehydrogenase family)
VLGFAEAGADVVIASRKRDACEEAAQRVRALGRRALPVAAHVGRWDDLERLADAAYKEFDRVDVLVNNAGMSPVAPSSNETSEALFDKVINVNLKGPFRLCALIGPRMVEAGGGSIINVSSSGALMPRPRIAPYSGAKAALNAITAAFALEYAPTVRVNALSAGPFLTNVSTAWDPEARASSRSAIGHPAEPGEVVGTALYLAGAASSYTTGAVIRVDGGLY